ncbi:aminotransferase class IV [Luteolibacter ambystomatis]|uniref:branched-chain-amino-acid transaminase n=1 Tax=Luteolibacter ambystomatis TaxID=2824561 RepID=A0A975J293_9BACT|nr:aminotransferase class IV [Luteolibacter ambystomatis]QUE52696.1 aminotransferase class IV [Luteolibacter ambystomatis]
MSRQVWCNGRMMSAEELRISPFDRGLTGGLGLFETILAIEGRPVFLERHLARHAEGCARLGWEAPQEPEIAEAIHTILAENQLTTGRARVRLFQTAGEGRLDALQRGPDAAVILTAAPNAPVPAAVSVTFSKWPRNERSALTGLKCASYAENLLALADARRQGYDEAYFLNTRGDVCEATTANLFVVKGGRITTPPLSSGCLPGITRGWLLETAAALGLSIAEERVTRNDLLEADEVFLTSATRGPVVVSRLDGREYAPPVLTPRCRAAWEHA